MFDLGISVMRLGAVNVRLCCLSVICYMFIHYLYVKYYSTYYCLVKKFLFVQTGGMYLGAVGAYDWSGTVVKYDSSNDQTPDITTFDQISKVLKNRTKVSYLGKFPKIYCK